MPTKKYNEEIKPVVERLEAELRLAELRAQLAEAQLRTHKARRELQELKKGESIL